MTTASPPPRAPEIELPGVSRCGYPNPGGAIRLAAIAGGIADELLEIRRAVRDLCDGFPREYWRSLEPDRYPEAFVQALTEHGWLAALIPAGYGGAGLELTAASV